MGVNSIGPDTHPLRLSVLITPTLQTVTLRLRVTKLACGGATFKAMEARSLCPERLTPAHWCTRGRARAPRWDSPSLSFPIYASREGITASQASELNESILHTVK